MCGIAGIWNFNEPLNIGELKTFTDGLEHRGPDGSGYELFDQDHLGLGHRRLSILDLSDSGSQPMTFAEFTVVFNGEIFNFEELKKELVSLGHKFNSKTDTEVLLASYKEWGEDCFHKFNGMWAFALYNKNTEELIISADRFGIKPLYYCYETGSRFSFASETYAYSHLKSYKKELNKKTVDLSLKDEYALDYLGHSIYKGIYRLLPGHLIKIKRGERPEQTRWYDIREKLVSSKLSFEEAKEKFTELFNDSCRIRLRSDVPLATALSGGIDSSFVYGKIKELSKADKLSNRTPEDIHKSFSMTFPKWENDERKYAEAVLEYYGAEGEFVALDSSGLKDKIESTTIKSDFLSSDPILPIYQVYARMKECGVTVSMDGHGADELMFGYKSMLWDFHSELLKRGDAKRAKEMEDYLIQINPESKQEGIKQYIQALKKNAKFPRKQMRAIKIALKGNKEEALTSMSNNPYDWSEIEDPAKRITLEYFFNKSLPSILRVFDKAAMLAGVEVRMPFMDYRLVEFCFSLPVEYMVNQEFSKLLLREAAKGIIPEEIRTRKLKLGFLSPIEVWLNDELKEWAAKKEQSDSYKEAKRYNESPVSSPNMRWKMLNLALINPSK